MQSINACVLLWWNVNSGLEQMSKVDAKSPFLQTAELPMVKKLASSCESSSLYGFKYNKKKKMRLPTKNFSLNCHPYVMEEVNWIKSLIIEWNTLEMIKDGSDDGISIDSLSTSNFKARMTCGETSTANFSCLKTAGNRSEKGEKKILREGERHSRRMKEERNRKRGREGVWEREREREREREVVAEAEAEGRGRHLNQTPRKTRLKWIRHSYQWN